jgi:tripartite-type tricarboxylate transporter receptor subunit TctC
MKLPRRTFLHLATGAAALPVVPQAARAQSYPTRLVATEPLVIVAKRAVPANDLKGLVAWLKDNPGRVSAGTSGVGSVQHVAAVYFQSKNGYACRALSRWRPGATGFSCRTN